MNGIMSPLRIPLDLRKHCIETEIKRLHNQSIGAYFKADANEKPALEPRIELLEKALKTFDFDHLRSTYPPMAGGGEADVALVSEPDNDLCLFVDREKIELSKTK